MNRPTNHRCELDPTEQECWYCGASAEDIERYGNDAQDRPEIPAWVRGDMDESTDECRERNVEPV